MTAYTVPLARSVVHNNNNSKRTIFLWRSSKFGYGIVFTEHVNSLSLAIVGRRNK